MADFVNKPIAFCCPKFLEKRNHRKRNGNRVALDENLPVSVCINTIERRSTELCTYTDGRIVGIMALTSNALSIIASVHLESKFLFLCILFL